MGYAWLLPFSEKEANLVIAYPGYPSNIKLDINDIRDRFYSSACRDLKQNFKITDNFQIARYMMGICNKPKVDNTYFVGNCFGSMSPGLGFGKFTSIVTGIYSVYDLCNLGKYEELIKPLFQNYNSSLSLRRFLENLSNDNLDFVIKNLDNKLLDKFIHKITGNTSKIDLLEIFTLMMKSWNFFKKDS